MMTPDYASPEQILGDPVTVASDVYSLGTVLYELLTGARPHRIERCTPLALERAICLDPVLAPSVAAAADRALARRLKGDLDNIILCAIQKEPARRYASVELLAEDLQRFLEHRPVTARPDSTAYRIGKFIRRNRLSVALGAVATLAVLTGAVVARQQAIVAHQHFQDVRKLASAFVFDVEDAVRPLPGSTRVRQLIARTGVEYLNRLSRSSARDWNLKRELASAWVRIGTVQGGENSSNLGDPGAALISFGNAGQLLDEVLRHDPSDAKAAFDRMKLFYEMSDLQWTLGRYKEAITSAEAGLRLAESRMSADAKDFETMRYAGLLHLALVRLHQQDGNLNAAEAEAAAGSRLVHLAAQASPDNRDTQLSLSELAARVGNVEAYRRRQDAALASYRSGVTVLEGLCRRYPQDTLIRHDLMIAYSHVGDTLGNFNLHYKNPSDLPGAFQAYAKMAEQAKFLYDADPADVRALADYGISLMRVGRVTAPAGPLRRATLERSLGLLNRAAAATPGNRMIATHIVWLDNELGEYAAAIVKAEASVGGKSVDLAMVLLLEKAVRGLSEAQARHRQREDALATLDHSMRWARSTNASGPQTSTTLILTAHAWQTSGSVYKILAGAETGERASEDRETARASYSKALAAWQKLEQAGTTLAPIESERKDAERALAPGGLESKRRSER
jgi:tetratricopeptide (TPR) repeat protein